jgi:predicted ATPase
LNYLFNTDNLTDFKPIKNLSELKKKIFIHIEEPELSLYPDAQCQLINDVVEKCFISNEKSNPIELFLSTHSPYIINHLNLLIRAYDTNKTIEGANINYENLAVYQIGEGKLINLMAQNERLVNTNPLSDPINKIYDQYNELG